MLKIIITTMLGFLTVPTILLAIVGVSQLTTLTSSYNMEAQYYWAGFFMPIVLLALFYISLPFWVD